MAKPASGSTLDTGHALATDMVACWPMLEGSGTTTADLTANNNDLTFAGGGGAPTWSTDGSGDAIIAIGTQLTEPLNPASAISLGASLASWSIAFRAKQTTSGDKGMVFGDYSSTLPYFWFFGGTFFGGRDNNNQNLDLSSITSFTSDANYVIVYDGAADTYTLWKDGASVQQLTSIVSCPVTIGTVGNAFNVSTFALVGSFTYMYVWAARALSSTDISDLHSDPYVMLDAPAGGSALSSTGTTNAQLVGSGMAAGVWSSAGVTDAQFRGSSSASGALLATGTTNAQFVGGDGSVVASGAWSAAGSTTVLFTGASTGSGAISSAGATSAVLVGAANASGVWSAAGATNAQFFGAVAGTINSGAWSSAGITTATFNTKSDAGGSLSVSGVTNAVMVGASTSGGVWSSAGATSVAFVGAAVGGIQAADWSSAGATVALFVGDGGVPIVPVVPDVGNQPAGGASGWSQAESRRARRQRRIEEQDERDVRDIQAITKWLVTEARFKRAA